MFCFFVVYPCISETSFYLAMLNLIALGVSMSWTASLIHAIDLVFMTVKSLIGSPTLLQPSLSKGGHDHCIKNPKQKQKIEFNPQHRFSWKTHFTFQYCNNFSMLINRYTLYNVDKAEVDMDDSLATTLETLCQADLNNNQLVTHISAFLLAVQTMHPDSVHLSVWSRGFLSLCIQWILHRDNANSTDFQ